MPGGRLRTFRLGDRSELLVENLLSGLAFTTRVPRQEDIGIDFMCSLIDGSADAALQRAGAFFSVQSKSSSEPISYTKPHEIDWITHQENPLLLCIADREAGAMDVYSTWNLICGVLAGWRGQRVPNCIRLCPREDDAKWPGVVDRDDGSQDIFLGKPIVRVSHDQIFDERSTEKIAAVLKRWVTLDRENIVNRDAGLNWVIAPRSYEIGIPPNEPVVNVAFYWNPKNLEKCDLNLRRSATALWNVLHHGGMPKEVVLQPRWNTVVPALEELLRRIKSVDPLMTPFLNDLPEH